MCRPAIHPQWRHHQVIMAPPSVHNGTIIIVIIAIISS